MTITFGPFALDPGTRQLTRGGEVVHLTPKAFELLEALVTERPNVLSKDALQRRLWPDTFVSEANLSNLIAEIRQALHDRARAPRFIRTCHGFGYAFCAEAAALPARIGGRLDQPVGWLQWDQHRFLLGAGEHVIGRGPEARIRLDHTTVSRRHARILMTVDGAATLEDFDSKNGTFLSSQRVTTPIRLADGDLIGIGSVCLTFHLQLGALSTETHAP